MVDLVRSEDGEGLSVDVGIPQSPGLDDGPDVFALCLQLTLQHPGRAPFGNLSQALRRIAVVLPKPEKKS